MSDELGALTGRLAERRVARVYRQDGTEDVISGDSALLGEDVLPGFTCKLATLL